MKVKRDAQIEHKLPQGKSLSDYSYALSDKLFHTEELFLYSEKVLPGKRASAPHYHRSIDEIIYITKGQLFAFEGCESIELRKGDSIYFSANSQKMHYLENQSEFEAEFLIFRKATHLNDVQYQ